MTVKIPHTQQYEQMYAFMWRNLRKHEIDAKYSTKGAAAAAASRRKRIARENAQETAR